MSADLPWSSRICRRSGYFMLLARMMRRASSVDMREEQYEPAAWAGLGCDGRVSASGCYETDSGSRTPGFYGQEEGITLDRNAGPMAA